MLRRTYLVNVLACPCGGQRRVVADVTDRDAIVAILSHLGLDPDAGINFDLDAGELSQTDNNVIPIQEAK